MPADQLTDLAALLTGPAGDHPAGPDWWQLYIEFTDWPASEQIAARRLAPLLAQVQATGLASDWWFIRKHPCWRIRLRPGPDPRAMKDAVGIALDGFASDGMIRRWWPGIYEPEEPAFGGAEGMAAAHSLFTADSAAIMETLRGDHDSSSLGRRELSVVLCTSLFNGAALEWYEQGDAWHRVTRERPLPSDVSADQISELETAVRILLTADTTPGSALFRPDGPLAAAAPWAAAFRQAGLQLETLARSGTLQRGLRQTLSYHIIFHWNRLGLTTRQQAILAHAAYNIILGPAPIPVSTPGGTAGS
jgi:thiopeptide-type bacteriocin biosynthesis protein